MNEYVEKWVKECCRTDPLYGEQIRNLFRSFQQWQTQSPERMFWLPQGKFKEQLLTRFHVGGYRNCPRIVGIALKPKPQ